MIYKWIEDCKRNIEELKQKMTTATTEEERERFADEIADEWQSLHEYEGRARSIEWERDYLNGEI